MLPWTTTAGIFDLCRKKKARLSDPVERLKVSQERFAISLNRPMWGNIGMYSGSRVASKSDTEKRAENGRAGGSVGACLTGVDSEGTL
jgi:hypothetical protein